MKKRLMFGIFSLAIASVIANAATVDLPMKGSGSGAIVAMTPGPNGVEISATGSGEATHLGKFTREESIVLNPATGAFTGTITFTAADGSTLECTLAGGFTGAGVASGTYEITGGTGRFANAEGEAFFNVTQSDPINFSFQFTGTISLN